MLKMIKFTLWIKKSGKLYTSDFSGNVNVVTNESVGEWVSN